MSVQNYPWSADCLNVVAVLAMSQGPGKLRRLARRFGLIEEGSEQDTIEIFRRVHEACHHHQDADVSKALMRELDDRFRSTLLRVRSMSVEEIKSLKMDWPMPLLWAILRDGRPEVQACSRYLVHSLMWDGLHRWLEYRERACDLQKPISLLQSQLRTQMTHISALRQDLEKKSDEAATLRRLASMRDIRTEAIGSNDAGQARLSREIRKLRHDLEKERKRVEELEAVISGQGRFFYEKALPDTSTVDTGERGKIPLCKNRPILQTNDLCGEREKSCKDCPLEGLRVALVGGIGGMMPEYRRVVTGLGAEFLFHDGVVGNGFRLRSAICGADIVVFITSVNSHGALNVVKAVCKNRRKKFVVLKETGTESLVRTLRKCAA